MPFLDADYAAIEARIVNWLAGQEDALERFRRYDAAKTKSEKHALDPYRIMASQIYGISVQSVNAHPQRFVGKGCELGAGFGLGPPKFRASCAKYGYDLPEGLEFKAIQTWRRTHKKTVQFWYDLEGAAKDAILKKGDVFAAGKHIKFQCRDIEGMTFLLMRLPSGRKISYPKPRIEGDRIHYFGNIPMTQKWGDISMWGGVLANNCLAGDTQVLSHRRGWVDLNTITSQDQVWDGLNFVQHQGLVNQGIQKVIEFHGMRVTPDHLFLGEESWISAQTACTNRNVELYSPDEASILSKTPSAHGFDRSEIWLHDGGKKRLRNGEKDYLDLQMPVWERIRKNRSGTTKRKIGMQQTMSFLQGGYWTSNIYARYEQTSGLSCVEKSERPMPFTYGTSLPQLWSTGDIGVRKVARTLREFLEGHGADLSKRNGYRPSRQRRGLHSRELPMGYSQAQYSKSTMHFEARRSATGFLGCSRGSRDQTQHALLSFESRAEMGTDHQHPVGFSEQVYDLLNCGPRHQFVVRSKHESGRLLIAHNCTQGTAADIMTNGAHRAEAKGYEICTLIHDEAISFFRKEHRAAGMSAEGFAACLTDLPPWANGLPVATDFGEVPFYKK